MEKARPTVGIVDYGMGNLFSVRQALEQAGFHAAFVTSAGELLATDAVVLPGVGAFGDAMANLRRQDLVAPLLDLAQGDKPLIGICLGMQLLMTESYEFGQHRGLGLVEGTVLRLPAPAPGTRGWKVPEVGWNRIWMHQQDLKAQTGKSMIETECPWEGSLLEGLPDGEFMYFVHSYYVQPEHLGVTLTTTRYGPVEFCSGLRQANIVGLQFHPERSGPQGLSIYRRLAAMIRSGD